MRVAEAVPQHDVLVLDVAVLRDISRQAVTAGMLVRIVAAGVALVRIEGRDPDVLGRKAAALRTLAALLREHQRARLCTISL